MAASPTCTTRTSSAAVTTLAELGAQLAAGSGHARENSQAEHVVWATESYTTRLPGERRSYLTLASHMIAIVTAQELREHLGEEYGGLVTAVTGFGLFVTLDNLYVEGLVHITELGGEYYRFDEARQELRGERTGVRYAVGARVRVQVSRVDLDGRKIDFRLVHPGDVLLSRAMRDKGAADQETRPAERKGKFKGSGARALPGENARSPIQALKASVKKAADKKKGKSARKSRR